MYISDEKYMGSGGISLWKVLQKLNLAYKHYLALLLGKSSETIWIVCLWEVKIYGYCMGFLLKNFSIVI